MFIYSNISTSSSLGRLSHSKTTLIITINDSLRAPFYRFIKLQHNVHKQYSIVRSLYVQKLCMVVLDTPMSKATVQRNRNKTDISLKKVSMYISFSLLCQVTLFYLQD